MGRAAPAPTARSEPTTIASTDTSASEAGSNSSPIRFRPSVAACCRERARKTMVVGPGTCRHLPDPGDHFRSRGVVLFFAGGKHPFGRRDDSGFIVLCCLAAGVYFGYRAWSSFQAERSLPGLTEENTAQAMSWAKMTACPPVGQGCLEVPQSIMEARQTCTWSGLCRIGAIVLKNDRSAEPWEVWIDGRTGLGRLRQRSRRRR